MVGRLSLIILILVASPAFSAEAVELENQIPIDLAKALIQIPFDGEVRFNDATPASFPEFTIPNEFDVVGGVTMAASALSQVVLSSEHELRAGLKLLTDSLQGDGYVLQLKMPRPQNGFVSDANIATVHNLCNDDLGALLIRALRRGSDNLYAISGNKETIDSSGRTCGDRIARNTESYDRMERINNTGLRAELPLLSVPIEEGSNRQGLITNSRGRGGNDYYETSSQLVSAYPATFVHDDFVEQLIDQDWELVQEISDRESNWRITIEDRSLFGELQIIEAGEGVLSLYFRISRDVGLYIEDSLLRGPIRGLN